MRDLQPMLDSIKPADPTIYAQFLHQFHTVSPAPVAAGQPPALGAQLAAIYGTPQPRVRRKALVIFVASHEPGGSPLPQDADTSRNESLLGRSAGAIAVARASGIELDVVSVPRNAHDLRPRRRARDDPQPPRDGDLAGADSMRMVVASIDAGVAVATRHIEGGANLLAVSMIDADESRHSPPAPASPIWPPDVLGAAGRPTMAAVMGYVVAAAANRVPVILDGPATTYAAFQSTRLNPNIRHYLIASHTSRDAQHRDHLETLGLEPVLGRHADYAPAMAASLALPLVEAATRLPHQAGEPSDP